MLQCQSEAQLVMDLLPAVASRSKLSRLSACESLFRLHTQHCFLATVVAVGHTLLRGFLLFNGKAPTRMPDVQNDRRNPTGDAVETDEEALVPQDLVVARPAFRQLREPEMINVSITRDDVQGEELTCNSTGS